MKQATLDNIKGRDLPADWAKRLGVRPDELVNVTVQSAAAKKAAGFDRKAVERILEEIKPVERGRPAVEIVREAREAEDDRDVSNKI